MENHIIPITMTRKIWNLVRVYFLMARKGISSKRKLLLDLNLMLKKGKIAGKALVGSLIFHHHHHHRHHQNPAPARTLSPSASFSTKGEYEFSCSHTPAHHAMFNFIHHLPALHANGNKHKKGNKAASGNNKNGENDIAAPGMECPEIFFDEENYEAVSRVLETLALREGDQGTADLSSLSVSSSLNYSSPAAYNLPALGFGRSPRVRQLRVTDSPFPLANNEDDHHVDEAAEDFINRFYSQLRQQRLTPGPHGA